MTTEQKIAKLEELNTTAQNTALEFNDIAAAKKKAMDEAIGEYTSLAENLAISELAAKADPMIELVKAPTYQTIAAKRRKKEKGDFGPDTFDIAPKEARINILELHKKVNGGIGNNKKYWPMMVEKFNFLIASMSANGVGDDVRKINDSYAMSQIARDYDLGKTPTSKTQLLKVLTTVVQAMIGESYKPTSHDVNFVLECHSRKSKKIRSVTAANHRLMREIMVDVCNHLVTGLPYTVEFPTSKNKS